MQPKDMNEFVYELKLDFIPKGLSYIYIEDGVLHGPYKAETDTKLKDGWEVWTKSQAQRLPERIFTVIDNVKLTNADGEFWGYLSTGARWHLYDKKTNGDKYVYGRYISSFDVMDQVDTDKPSFNPVLDETDKQPRVDEQGRKLVWDSFNETWVQKETQVRNAYYETLTEYEEVEGVKVQDFWPGCAPRVTKHYSPPKIGGYKIYDVETDYGFFSVLVYSKQYGTWGGTKNVGQGTQVYTASIRAWHEEPADRVKHTSAPPCTDRYTIYDVKTATGWYDKLTWSVSYKMWVHDIGNGIRTIFTSDIESWYDTPAES